MNTRSLSLSLKLIPLALALIACEPTHTAEEHIRRAQEAERKGDPQAALIELKNAAQKNPRSAQARVLLAQHYVKAGQGADAEKEIKRALELGHGIEGLKPLYADALLQQGHYQRVLDELRPSEITARPERAHLLRAHADARLGLKQPEQGCPLYQEALRLDPKQVEAYWGLSRCALLAGKRDEAKAQLHAAINAVPGHPGSWVRLGDLERSQNRPEAAIQAYTTALKHQPKERLALFGRAQVLALSGKLKEAETDTQALAKLAPDYYGTHFMQALLHFAAGRLDPALEAVQKALKAHPDYLPAHLLQAHLSYYKGAYDTALRILNAILQVAPAYTEARKLAALAHLRLDQPGQALAVLEPLIVAGQADAQVLALAGEARLRQDDPTAAQALFAQAASRSPQASVLDLKWGLSLLAAGEEAQGTRVLENAARHKNDPRAEAALAYHFLAGQRYDEALKILAGLEQRFPDNPGVHNLKGVAYAGKNDRAQARASFERALSLRPGLTSAALRLAALDLAEGKLEQARARYEGLLKRDKGNVPALVGLAELAGRQKREAEYVQRLEQAVQADPAAIVPRAMLADYFVAKRQPLKALEHARQAAERNPARPEALALLARIQLAAGERAGAVSAANKLVAQLPRSAEAHYQLAQALAAQGDAKAVRAALSKALELDAGHLGARVALARLEARTGRAAEALRHARELQARHPQAPIGHELEGDAQLLARRPAEAAAAYARALERGRNAGLAVKQHQALLRAGQAARADALLADWLRAQPQDANVRAYLAESYLARGMKAEARREYETLLAARPEDAGVLNNLAVLYHAAGDRRALELAEQAHKLQPDAPAIADTLGWLLVQAGQSERGLKLLEQAVAKAADDAEVRYHYAYALHAAGRLPEARRELIRLRALQLTPELRRAVEQLGQRLP